MSPRQPDPQVRLQLVEAAARLLDGHGIDGVTARGLATAIGASTQAVYTHFERMDDVIAEVWREGFRRFGAALDEPAISDDPVADFMTQGWGYRRFALHNPHLYRVMFGAGMVAMHQGVADDLEAASSTFLSLLTRIDRCRGAGRWQVEDVYLAGEMVWSTVHGHTSIELTGYFAGLERDPVASYTECLRRIDLGFGDDPEQGRRSVRSARRRAQRADLAVAAQN